MSPPSPKKQRFRVSETLLLYVLTLILLVVAQPLLVAFDLGGIVFGEVALIAGPTLLLLLLSRRDAGVALGFRLPPARAVAGAVLIGASLWLVLAITVAPLVERLAPPEELEQLREQLVGGGTPIWLRLSVLALAPAVCEEILFRGAIARSLAPRIGLWGAVLVSAILFGLFHFSPARMIPTAILGLFLAWAALRTGSIVPAMVIHFLNNSFALLAAGAEPPSTAGAEAVLTPTALLAAAAALGVTLTGCWLVSTSRADPS